MRRVHIALWPLVCAVAVCGLVMAQGYEVGYDKGYTGAGVYGDWGGAPVDTFRLLVRDAARLPTTAVDSGWVEADEYYDTIVDNVAGSGMRYGFINSAVPNGPTYEVNGIRTNKADEYDRPAPAKLAFICFDISSLTTGDLVEDAYLCLNTMRFSANNFTAGYFFARIDTNLADFAMLNPASDSADPNWLATTYTHVDSTGGTLWSPAWSSRDDWNDLGPRSEMLEFGRNLAAEEGVRLGLKDGLQQVLDSGTQGRWLILAISQSLLAGNETAWMAGSGATQVPGGNPCLTVTTTSNRGNPIWDGMSVPFILSIDDGLDTHAEFADIITGAGHPYSEVFFGLGSQGGVGKLDAAEWSAITANPLVDMVVHSRTHTGLGGLATENARNYEAARDWVPTSLAATDTVPLDVFAYPGAASDALTYSIAATATMVDNGYFATRCARTGWTDPSGTGGLGLATYAGLDNFVNMQAIAAIGMRQIAGDLADTNTVPEMKEALRDKIDKAYYENGRAPLITFWHSTWDEGDNGISFYMLGQLIDFVDANPRWGFMSFRRAMELRLHGQSHIAPDQVTVANGSTLEEETSAAMSDSAFLAGSDPAYLELWLAPIEE